MSVQFGSGSTIISCTWTTFKSGAIVAKALPVQYDDDGTVYTIFGFDGPLVYVCTIWKGSVPDGVAQGGYSQESNDADKAAFETVYKAGANKPLEQRTSNGASVVSPVKSTSSKKNFYSIDWCDKTTWYQSSTLVTSEVATDSGDHLTYTLAHQFVIDTYHGKTTNEDFLQDAGNFSYRVAVKVNGTTKTEQDPHTASGGDFIVDYEAGAITFLSGRAAEDVVTVTYHYAGSSLFTLKPDPGTLLTIDFAEVQFSTNMEVTDSIKFQPYGYVQIFAPQYWQANGGPYPTNTLIPLGNPLVYKGIRDYFNDAVRAYPNYPAIGTNWRGMPEATTVLDWDYVRATVLRSSWGMEVRIFLQHDVPFEGAYATTTFYCGMENE